MTQASGRFLLDTNIIIALFSGDEEVLEKLTQAFEVFIPAVVIGELYFGAAKSHKRDENIARIEELIVSQQIVACDVAVAREDGRLKEGLKRLAGPYLRTTFGSPPPPATTA